MKRLGYYDLAESQGATVQCASTMPPRGHSLPRWLILMRGRGGEKEDASLDMSREQGEDGCPGDGLARSPYKYSALQCPGDRH